MASSEVVVAGVPVSTDHLIGPDRVPSRLRFSNHSPNDWSEIGEIARGDAEVAEAAVSAALAAYPTWAGLGAEGRAARLHALADLIDEHTEQIAQVETADMAMLLSSLRERVVHRGAENFRNYADLAAGHRGRSWSSRGTENRVIRSPAGPAVIVTPWNAPWLLSTWKVAPALAAGNPVVLKPAEWAPLSASLLGDLALEAGLPPGALNIVQGIGEEVGAALVADPRVRRISFTGSPEAGRRIGMAAASNLVPYTAELGGKGPLVVFDDADIEEAARRAALMFDDSGQVCLAGTRLIVHHEVADRFLEVFHRHTDSHVLGDSRSPDTTITPLIHPDHLARVAGFVDRAVEAGDVVVRGGRVSRAGGLWYEPTLVAPRSNSAEIVQREVFGPVLTFQTFVDDAEAVAKANSTPYGLSAILFTGSRERAERLGAAMRAGIVWVNTYLVRDLTAPFGGCGISGIGREGGDHSLDFHSDLMTWQLRQDSVH